MPRLTLAATLALFTACAPKDPATTATDGDASTSEATTAATTTSTATTAATTDPATTTGDGTGAASSSGATTSDLPACSWQWPENWDLVFCPSPAAMNADVSGTTPFGPVELHYAHFGLFECASCPTAQDGSLSLYADPPTLGESTGDRLAFEWLSANSLQLASFSAVSQIGGQPVKYDPTKFPTDLTLTDLVFPPDEQTAPPLDEAMPPVVSATLHLTGNGWDVHGSFTASLCTTLNWTPFCE